MWGGGGGGYLTKPYYKRQKRDGTGTNKDKIETCEDEVEHEAESQDSLRQVKLLLNHDREHRLKKKTILTKVYFSL